jgi:hypothetical protein
VILSYCSLIFIYHLESLKIGQHEFHNQKPKTQWDHEIGIRHKVFIYEVGVQGDVTEFYSLLVILSYCSLIFIYHLESLKGQVVWITGSSSGIGEALAYKLSSLGCKLVLSARREDRLQKVKDRCLAGI